MTDSRAPLTAEPNQFLPRPATMVAWGLLVVIVALSYTSSYSVLLYHWKQDDYQHCWFVPAFCLYLLWTRRDLFLPLQEQWSVSATVVALAAFLMWAGLRVAGAYFAMDMLPVFSIVPFLLGLTLMAGGWRALRWAWPAVLFTLFMIPLPDMVAGNMRYPLQMLATKVSVFVIQTLGIPAEAFGTVIQLPDGVLGVEQACSGLRMLMLFFALCIGAALLLRDEPVWKRIVIVVSAVPIAVASNVTRIVMSAVFHQWMSLDAATQKKVFTIFGSTIQFEEVHDWLGYLMMPLGIGLLVLELAILNRLLPTDEDDVDALEMGGSLGILGVGPGEDERR